MKRSFSAGARRLAAFALAAAVTAGTSVLSAGTAFAVITSPQEPADVGKTAAELNGYTEERWAQLMDDRLDYDEVQDLVHNFNPAITSAWSNLNDNIRLMNTIEDNLRARRRDMKQLKENAKQDGDYASYGNYYMQEVILDKSADAFHKSLDRMERPVTQSNQPLRAAERQVTVAVKQLMIGYSSLMEQRAIVSDSLGMYTKLYADAQARQGVGQATAADVQAAYAEVLNMQAQLSTLDVTAEQLRKNLIMLCGWGESASPVIGDIPAPDISRIEGMDPDTDIRKAAGNNADILSFRHAAHSNSTASLNVRGDSEELMTQNLLANLRAQYQEILADKAALDAARTGMQAAEMTKNAADLQYQLGMLSTAGYLGALTQYQSARTTLSTAENTLFQALESYDWAVAGVSSAQ